MLKIFCARCGQAVEASEKWRGHPIGCPNCGSPMEWPGGTPNSNRRRQVITGLLASLVVIALLLLLMQPSRFGSFGGAAREGLFGSGLVGRGTGSEGNSPSNAAPGGATGITTTNQIAANPVSAPTQSPAPAPISGQPGGGLQTNPPPTTAPQPSTTQATNEVSTNRPAIPASTRGSLQLKDDFTPRLSAEGAKTGDIQISLIWGDINDIDLHCVDPRGFDINYGHRRSPTGGELDVDKNADAPLTTTPVENIYWPFGGAPNGNYTVYIDYFRKRHPSPAFTAYKVRVLVRGQKTDFSGTITPTERNKFIYTFTLPTNR